MPPGLSRGVSGRLMQNVSARIADDSKSQPYSVVTSLLVPLAVTLLLR